MVLPSYPPPAELKPVAVVLSRPGLFGSLLELCGRVLDLAALENESQQRALRKYLRKRGVAR